METISGLLLNYVVNAAWMVTIIAAVAWLAGTCVRQAHARSIHRLWMASLGLSVLLPILGMARLRQDAGTTPNLSAAAAVEHTASPSARRSGIIVWMSASAHKQSLPFAPLLRRSLLFLYCCFLLRGILRLSRSWRQTKAICRNATIISLPPSLRRAAEQSFRAFGLRPPIVAVSKRLSGPSTAGLRRPILMFPEWFIAEAREDDFTFALCHELAHIRHRDFSWNLISELLMIPICFHPAAAFIKRRADCTREIACDEMAAQHSTASTAYARSLLNLANGLLARNETSQPNYALGLFDSDTLEERIMTLLKQKSLSQTAERLLLLAASAFLIVTCGFTTAFSLQVAPPKVDAADVRPFIGTWEAKFNGKTFQTIKLENTAGKLSGTANHIAIALDSEGSLIDARAHEGSDDITSAKVEGNVLHFTCTGKAHMDTATGTSDAEKTEYEMKLAGEGEAEIRPIGEGVDAPQLKPWKLERVKK